MSVKTIRFNDGEEKLLQKLMDHYGLDFSSCIKMLLREKLEDLVDAGWIKGFKEGKPDDYHSAEEIDKLF